MAITKTGSLIKVAVKTTKLRELFLKRVKPNIVSSVEGIPDPEGTIGPAFTVQSERSYQKLINALKKSPLEEIRSLDGGFIDIGRGIDDLEGLVNSKIVGIKDKPQIFFRSPSKYFESRGYVEKMPFKGEDAEYKRKFTRAIQDRLMGLHEADELVATKDYRRNVIRGKEITTPTRHTSPEVLLKEHNMLTTLEGAPEDVKNTVIKNMRSARNKVIIPKSNTPGLTETDVIDKTLGRLGPYGSGARVNRSARKHLIDIMNRNYQG